MQVKKAEMERVVVLLGAFREFERRTGELTERRGAKREMIVNVIERLAADFQVADIERACPGVSRPTISIGPSANSARRGGFDA